MGVRRVECPCSPFVARLQTSVGWAHDFSVGFMFIYGTWPTFVQWRAGLGNLTQIKQGAHTHPAQRGGTIPDEEKCTHSHTHTRHCAMMQSIHERSDDAQCFCLLMMRRECTHCRRQHLSFPLGVRGGGVHIWLRIFWEFAAQVPMCVRDGRG